MTERAAFLDHGAARRVLRAGLAGCALMLGLAVSASHAKPPPKDFVVEVLSSRPDSVTAGDALLRIDVPRNVPMQHVTVRLNGADVSASFVRNDALRSYTGLLSGMTVGDNTLGVYSNGRGQGRPTLETTIKNHPVQGPVFSGPHQQPYICATQSFNLPAGLGNLGPTTDPNCHIARRVDYLYRTTANTLAAWPAGATSYPANLASTTTTQGKTVPCIVRMKTGTSLYSNDSPLMQRMILTLDRWITAVRDDTRDLPQIDKVVQNKPADLQEGCNTRTASPSFINRAQVRDPATSCEGLYPSNSFPREVAGAAVAADVVKCQTKPLSAADYAAPFTAVQWARLQAAFPAGVCDWSRAGVEQQPPAGTWQRF